MSSSTSGKAIIARELAASLALNRGLIEDFNPTWRDDLGRSMMHRAVLLNDKDLVQDMLIAGLSVFDKDRVGATPLHLAVLVEGSDDIVDLLLGQGARPNEPKGDGLTPLHEACWCGNASAVKKFLPLLEDLQQLDVNGRTPRDLAREYDKPDIIALIDAEVHLRRQEELAEVTKTTSGEWSAILRVKQAAKK